MRLRGGLAVTDKAPIIPGGPESFPIHQQRNRRNLMEAEILRRIEVVDKKKSLARDRTGKLTAASRTTGKSSRDATGRSAVLRTAGGAWHKAIACLL